MNRGWGRSPLAWALLLLLLLGQLTGTATADPPQVGVRNIPPQFRYLALGARADYQFIDVTVSDFNGWHDILRVDIVILDEFGGTLGHVRFQQYARVNATYIPSTGFEDLEGGLLRREVSYYWASNLTDTYVERSEINLTFALRPIRGSSLDLLAVDLGGAFAEVKVDYALSSLGLPGSEPFLPPPLSSLDLSTLIALIFAGLITSLLMAQRYGGAARLLGHWRRRGT